MTTEEKIRRLAAGKAFAFSDTIFRPAEVVALLDARDATIARLEDQLRRTQGYEAEMAEKLAKAENEKWGGLDDTERLRDDLRRAVKHGTPIVPGFCYRLLDEIDQGRAEVARLEGVVCAWREAVGTSQAWTAADILNELARMTDHLMQDHDCDHHGYESSVAARDESGELADRIRAALATAEPCGHARRVERMEKALTRVAEWARGRQRIDDEAEEQGGEEFLNVASECELALEDSRR